MAATLDDAHFERVAELLADGEVVPFLGAGANMCDRPVGAAWEGGQFLPSGAELAGLLAARSRYPQPTESDLLRVSQFVDAILGQGQLYRYLRAVLDVDYPPTSLHRLLARLPARLRAAGRPQALFLTTNYDDLLERALADQGETFDVIWYEAKRGGHKGLFLHRLPAGDVEVVDLPNEYTGLALAERPAILKLHGAIDRRDPGGDSYVITENDYIEYLTDGDVGDKIPFTLRARLEESHFLFLGYSMRDWNLRVVLTRLWGARKLDLKSWAVQHEPEDPAVRAVEETLWRDRGDVDLVYSPLAEYVVRLEAELAGAARPAT